MRPLQADPQRGDGGQSIPADHQWARQHTEDGQMQRLQHAEQKKRAPRGPLLHAAVELQNELNPGADAEPVDDPRGPTETEP